MTGPVPDASDAPVLPPYPGIRLADVCLVTTPGQLATAQRALLAADAIGFDTESKPTFQKGEASTGPHLIQLATDSTAYLFQIGGRSAPELVAMLREILESEHAVKVGFGLSDDVKRLRAKLGITCARVLDLSVALRTPGQRNDLGAKTAVAKFFSQQLQKSKKISTTNWSSSRLNDKQILYAADDAHVALRIFRHWIAAGGKPPAIKPPRAPRNRAPAVAPASAAPAASSTLPASPDLPASPASSRLQD